MLQWYSAESWLYYIGQLMLSINYWSIVIVGCRIKNILQQMDFLKRWLILSKKKVYVQIKSQTESNKDFKVVKIKFYYTDVNFKS